MTDNAPRSSGTSPRPPRPGSSRPSRRASHRRVRYGLSTLAIILCASISVALANLIALDPRLRLIADVTATGEHRLAPRTQQVLASLPPGSEIVVAGAASTDRAVRRRVADVLDAMARTNSLTVSWIDDPAGPQYAALIARLIERDRPAIMQAGTDLSAFADELDRASSLLDRLSTGLADISTAIPTSAARDRLSEYAGVARLLGTDARAASQSIRDALAEPTALGVPPLDRALSTARRSLSRLATELQSLSTALVALTAADSTPREAALRAAALTQQLTLGRDPIALASDRAAGLTLPDLVRVARVLESSQAVLVVSPTGLGAVEFDTLFPASIPETVGGARADIGAQAEDLLTSALASLAGTRAPIIVFVHAEDARLLDQNAITSLLSRLALRRIDAVEWRVVAEPDPPGLAALDPDASRPVVYVTLGASSNAAASGPSNLTGPDRAQRLGAALRRLADRGAPILLSISPSTLPTFGGTDDATAFLADFGLHADSGRPLLTERLVNGRRFVEADRLVTTLPPSAADAAASSILGATTSLAIGMRAVTPIEAIEPPAGVRASLTPLIQVAGPDTWAESQWIVYLLQTPPEQRSRVTQPPTPDPDRDDTIGPWNVAYAAERSVPGLSTPQRLIAIGSNGWFADALAAQTEVVNGRVVPTLPGNTELFEAAVYWLAGQEDFIARSAASGSVPTIRPLSSTESTVIHWLVLAIMPLGTLALGVAWRLTRG